MFLTYLGESGSTGKSAADPSQPHLVYAGLLVHESQSMSMNGEFSALCRRHFGAPLGEQGAPTEIRPVDVYQGLGLLRLMASVEEERTDPRLPGHNDPAGNPCRDLIYQQK